MNMISRRSLARYGADQLLAGAPARIVAKHLAAVLIDSGRQKEAELLLADINYELQKSGRLATATVTTARVMSASLRGAMASSIKKASKVEAVILHEQIDASVIGGMRIETAERTWDKTIATQVSKLRGVV